MTETLKTAAIIVAAGRGLRAGSGGPKQYRSIAGRTVISRAMEPFCGHPDVSAVQPVLNPDDTVMFNEAVAELRYQPPTAGGATRQASVHAGLEALVGHAPDIVLIHDAARPFVTPALIAREITVRPAMLRYCLGPPDPARRPRPAATIMAAVLGVSVIIFAE